MTSEDDLSGYSLVVSFSNLYPTMPEEAAFCHGVEFGGLWRDMTQGSKAEIKATTHAVNRTVIARAAAAQGWELSVRGSEIDGWDYTVLRKVAAARSNPHGLHVVKTT